MEDKKFRNNGRYQILPRKSEFKSESGVAEIVNTQLAAKDVIIAEKEAIISEKDKVLVEKDKVLVEKDKEIRRLTTALIDQPKVYNTTNTFVFLLRVCISSCAL